MEEELIVFDKDDEYEATFEIDEWGITITDFHSEYIQVNPIKLLDALNKAKQEGKFNHLL